MRASWYLPGFTCYILLLARPLIHQKSSKPILQGTINLVDAMKQIFGAATDWVVQLSTSASCGSAKWEIKNHQNRPRKRNFWELKNYIHLSIVSIDFVWERISWGSIGSSEALVDGLSQNAGFETFWDFRFDLKSRRRTSTLRRAAAQKKRFWNIISSSVWEPSHQSSGLRKRKSAQFRNVMNMALADGGFQMIKMGYVQPAVAETEHLMVMEKWKLRGFNGDRINSSAMGLCPNLGYSNFIIILIQGLN